MSETCARTAGCDWHPYADEPLMETCRTAGCGIERPISSVRAWLATRPREMPTDPVEPDTREGILARIDALVTEKGGAA